MIKTLWRNHINKATMNNAFVVADLCLKVKKNDTELRRFPVVSFTKETDDTIFFIFYLPAGMNPENLMKKEYVFKQVFNMPYEMSGDGRRYEITFYKTVNDSAVVYDVEVIKKAMSGNIPILAGYDMLGNLHSYDANPDPHLLIAGETGSGKSVTLRSILTSLLLFKRHEIDFYLADMKRAEFHLFRNCDGVKEVMTTKPHLHKVLNQLRKELDLRGELLDRFGVEHIDEYNKLKGVEPLKTIMIAIDEVAILRDSKNITSIIEDIATQGRALKMQLILSMQRPDAKILNGQLKACLTVRYAFKHADAINSNITLGSGSGVDASTIKKTEKGKFYFRNQEIRLLQAPYLTLEHAKELLAPIKITPPKENEPVIDDNNFDDDIEDIGGIFK
jgi:DNA segregation ATPase FtsK/SpoIIIE, S-DNA-T family